MQTKSSANNIIYSISVLGVMFFIFGFITWINGTLIQFLKILCELESDFQSFLVTFAFYIAYFFLALPSARILKYTGYKKGMSWGLLIISIGSFIFIPATIERDFRIFLLGLFLQASGIALLQTASNPYISILGDIRSAAKRISIMGICNKFAGILSPFIFSLVLLKDASSIEAKILQATTTAEKESYLIELSHRVQTPYIIVGVVLLLLAVLVFKSSLPEIDTNNLEDSSVSKKNPNPKSIFQQKHLLLGVLAIFLYVGLEVMAGDAIGVYGQSIGISIDDTKYFTTYTLASMLLGYIFGITFIPKYLSQEKALLFSSLLGLIFSFIVFFSSGYTSIIFIALLGLANALMWPAIFPLAIKNLGRHTAMGSGLLIMGVSGGAIIPLIYAELKDGTLQLSNSVSFLVCMAPCYAFILYYALKGHTLHPKMK